MGAESLNSYWVLTGNHNPKNCTDLYIRTETSELHWDDKDHDEDDDGNQIYDEEDAEDGMKMNMEN